MNSSNTDTHAIGRIPLVALAIGSFGIGTSEFSSMGLMPLFSQEFGTSVATGSQAITAYATGVFIGAPLLTLIASRLNRRTLLLALALILVLGNLVSGLASSFGMLLVGRFISGMPQGAYFGAGAVVASYILGPGGGGRAFALIAFGMTVATVVGAPLGTFIGHHLGWQTTYLSIAVYSLLTLAVFACYLPRSSSLDGGPVMQELASVWNSRIWLLMGIAALCVSSTFAVYTFIAPIVTEVAAQAETLVPVALAMVGLGIAVGTPIGGRAADGDAFRSVVVWFSATLVVLFFMGTFGGDVAVLLPLLFAVGVTLMAAVPSIAVLMTKLAPGAPTMMGALNMAAFNVANALGAAASGMTIAAGMGYMSSIWAGFAMTLAGLVVFVASSAFLSRGSTEVADLPAE
ncbi:MFS transporter [Sinorhizobium medicae]|nr:MFS transporter [Sinorhizobium medicae]